MRTAMSGQPLPVLRKLRSELSTLGAYQRRMPDQARVMIRTHRELLDTIKRYVDISADGARALEIGVGQKAAQSALFRSDGITVTGIDLEVPTYGMTLRDFFRAFRANGAERAVKSAVRHCLFDKKYYRELAKQYGVNVDPIGLDIRVMDATRLEFEPDTFDVIYSQAVFEHIDNVEGAVRELNRVLKPDGVGVVNVHLFGCVTGGHCSDWMDPERWSTTAVPPWDHLRENLYPPNTYLNKMKLGEYRRIFGSICRVVAEESCTQGEELLTDELAEELYARGYAREDLITHTVDFVVRKG